MGIEIPVMANAMTTRSTIEFCRKAAIVPALIPTTIASNIASEPNMMDIGSAAAINSLTRWSR